MVSRTSSGSSVSPDGTADDVGAEDFVEALAAVAEADAAGDAVTGIVLGAGTSGAPRPSRNSPQYRHLMAPALMVSRQ